ncbi:MAG: hypothetical protein ACJ8BW_00335, partial [Ktedonobacteraceae bacterium]
MEWRACGALPPASRRSSWRPFIHCQFCYRCAHLFVKYTLLLLLPGFGALPVGVCVRVLNQLDFCLLGVHALVPGLLAHPGSRVLNRFRDGLPGSVKVNAQKAMVVLDDLAVHHHGMHIPTPGLKHDVTVGMEQREH